MIQPERPPMIDRTPLVLYADAIWESPYVFTCFVALHEKELPFEVRTVDIDRGEQHAPVYRDRSLTARVPALVHDDFWLTESTAIIEYLEESFPRPAYRSVLPPAPRERARARQLMAWLRSDLQPLRDERPTRSIFLERTKAPLSTKARVATEKLLRVVGEVLPVGQNSLFDEFSVADSDLALAMMRLIANGDEVPDRLRAYAAAIWQRPSVRAFASRERPTAGAQ